MTLSSSPSIRRGKSLHEQVYQALRTAVLTGELAPGDRLVETQLADWLQVSRTPLREALRQLQQEGLVTADTSGGLRVTTISATDARELYDCRLALEELAMVGACAHATPAQLQQIEACVIEAEALNTEALKTKAGSLPSHQKLLDLDYKFHRLIAESSQNKRLISLLDTLFNAMALLRIQTLKQNPNVLEIRLEHRQIYQALLARNPQVATEAMRQHLTASKARVVQEIEVYQPDLSKPA